MWLKNRLLTLFVLVLASCSHTPKIIPTENKAQILDQASIEINLNQFAHSIEEEVKKVRSLINKKNLTEQDIQTIDKFYLIYKTIKNLSGQTDIKIPAKTKLTMPVKSFCLNPDRSTPSQFELYTWTQDDPKIPYFKQIMEFSKTQTEYKQSEIQNLIWNLYNGTYYENYPSRQKELIKKFDPNPEKNLPSRLKDQLSSTAQSILQSAVPEVGMIKKIIRGKYYDYKDYEQQVNHLKSKHPENKEHYLTEIKNSLYAQIQSKNFSEQIVTFVNPNSSNNNISLSDYHLKPLRDDVQRLGLYANIGFYKNLEKIIDDGLRDTVTRNVKYWYGDGIEENELELINKRPLDAFYIYVQAKHAIILTQKRFGRSDDGDESDAFRHFMWAGLSTNAVGEIFSRDYLYAHEGLNTQDRTKIGDYSIHVQMDIHNNELGVEAALELIKNGQFSSETLEKAAINKFKEGALKIIRSTGDKKFE